MKVYHSLAEFKKLDFAVVTSGTFDGVHLGHQKILNRLKEIALKHNGETVVITYWPHPQLILNPDNNTLKLLNSYEEREQLLREQGIQHLLKIPFTKEFSQITSEEFITNILVNRIGTKKLVIGYDHRFGKNREGSFEELKKDGPTYGFDVEEITRQDVDSIGISSSAIRNALLKGEVNAAAHLLGRAYSISGIVVMGDQLGRTLGYPTANLALPEHHKLIPAEGIYAATVSIEGRLFGGMLYIGNRPTLENKKLAIEVNIFDFNEDLYGKTIQVNFINFIRPDKKFDNLEQLKNQLVQDKVSALQLLSS
jgi:riboflavin kinase/FMN adenylyltransferase